MLIAVTDRDEAVAPVVGTRGQACFPSQQARHQHATTHERRVLSVVRSRPRKGVRELVGHSGAHTRHRAQDAALTVEFVNRLRILGWRPWWRAWGGSCHAPAG